MSWVSNGKKIEPTAREFDLTLQNRRFFLTRECAHAHERVIAIMDFSLGRLVARLVGSVVNFRACAVNEF